MSGAFRIREATPDDFDSLRGLFAAARKAGVLVPQDAHAGLHAIFTAPDLVRCVLFHKDAVPVGFAILSRRFGIQTAGPECVIESFYLPGAARNSGEPGAAVQGLVQAARRWGAGAVHVVVGERDADAGAFWSVCGFKPRPGRWFTRLLASD